MKRNGHKLVILIDNKDLKPGIWDPYQYRDSSGGSLLSEYVDVIKVVGIKHDLSKVDFEPIEYKHIPKGNFLTFLLKEKEKSNGKKFTLVSENVLLFGTMRAYLGNVLVTPFASWIGKSNNICFPLNSEFCQILPKDGLTFYWWSFLKSPTFLNTLPTGSGGTRPRVDIGTLLKTEVLVHKLKERKEINAKLIKMAEMEWIEYTNKEKLLKDSWGIL